MTDRPVRLRRAGEDDAVRVAELWLDARRAAPGVPAPVHSDRQVRAWLRERLASADAWVTTDEADRPSAVMVLDGEWIEQLYVLPERQRQGLGSALLELAQAERGSLALWTFEANTAARSFYERHGFWPCGEPSAENEERTPAICYRWSRSAAEAPAGGTRARKTTKGASTGALRLLL